jgi:hypothetical protein
MLAGFYPFENHGGGQGLTQAVVPVGRGGIIKQKKERKEKERKRLLFSIVSVVCQT